MRPASHRFRPQTIAATIALQLLLLASWLPAQKIGEVPKAEPSLKAARGETLEAQSSAGQPYWYRLPKNLSKKKPCALIFMLHGTGMNHGWSFWNYGIAKGQFRKDDIVVSPEGVTPGNGTSFNFSQNAKDSAQLVELIKKFKKAFPIRSVYLYGHSQGAFFTFWFAGEHPELVDGICAHAGNVLGNVKHPKLAKTKVAIGILHAESDQVVPVACAYASKKVYETQGYTKLKVEIPTDIRKQAGHWPLPPHVKKMFEWLDQVSVASTQGALEVAEAQILSDAPDLNVIAESLHRAKTLLKREKGAAKKALGSWLALCESALGAQAKAHLKHLQQDDSFLAAKSDLSPTTIHFRTLHSALQSDQNWKSIAKKTIARAKKEERGAGGALKKLNKVGVKAFTPGLKALQKSPWAPSSHELQAKLVRIASDESSTKKISKKLRAQLEGYVQTIAPHQKAALEAMARVTKECAEAFRKTYSEAKAALELPIEK